MTMSRLHNVEFDSVRPMDMRLLDFSTPFSCKTSPDDHIFRSFDSNATLVEDTFSIYGPEIPEADDGFESSDPYSQHDALKESRESLLVKEQELEQKIKQASELLISLREAKISHRESLAVALRRSVLILVEKIIQSEVSTNSQFIESCIAQATGMLAGLEENTVLLLHPDDYELIKGDLDTYHAHIRIKASREISPGNVRLSSLAGEVEVGIDTRMAQLQQAIEALN